jgi:fructosamine-3-kinase
MDGAAMEVVASLLGARVVGHRAVGGGCIADARRVELADGRVVFTKSGAGLPAGLLGVEAEGLRWLGEPGVLAVPEVLAYHPDPELLVLEWIESGPSQPSTPERFGRGLALLHAAGAPSFGGHRDGFIGSLPQPNLPLADGGWPEFWFVRRIEPFARQAHDQGSLPAAALGLVDRLGARLAELAGPSEPPARVHGDLWSGNVMVDTRGEPWVVDPAAYGGHREVDLAMLTIWGSLGAGFVPAYEAVRPLAEGWRERLRLWQFEPLLVHAVLFGGGYGGQALDVLRHYA